jgi:hypothetical protein
MKIWLSLLKFFFLGALFIISNENLHLTNPLDLEVFTSQFTLWLGNLFEHSMEITSYVVNSEWLPGDSTTRIFPI